MAIPPRSKSFSMESIPGAPEWLRPLLVQLNAVLGELVGGVTNQLTRSENMRSQIQEGFPFTTAASVGDTWPLRIENKLGTPPRHVWVTRLERKDHVAIASAWSCTWALSAANKIELRLQGLDASTEYVLSFIAE